MRGKLGSILLSVIPYTKYSVWQRVNVQIFIHSLISSLQQPSEVGKFMPLFHYSQGWDADSRPSDSQERTQSIHRAALLPETDLDVHLHPKRMRQLVSPSAQTSLAEETDE